MIRELIALDNSSRVWIYQADRELSYDEIDVVRPNIFSFVNQWSTHGTDVDAYGNIFHKRFIVLFADDAHQVSGCSIDSSVSFIRQLGEALKIDFFNREQFAFMEGEDIFTVHKNELPKALETVKVKDSTFVFDNLVSTKEKFLKSWLVPFGSSWHKRFA
jgi:hypothetical protein